MEIFGAAIEILEDGVESWSVALRVGRIRSCDDRGRQRTRSYPLQRLLRQKFLQIARQRRDNATTFNDSTGNSSGLALGLGLANGDVVVEDGSVVGEDEGDGFHLKGVAA